MQWKNNKISIYSTKKWDLKINEEIILEYEKEFNDVTINDNYNNVKGSEIRSISTTIIKVKEEEDTSSVSS